VAAVRVLMDLPLELREPPPACRRAGQLARGFGDHRPGAGRCTGGFRSRWA